MATGYDGDWNCLLSFKNISDMTRQSSEMPSRRITSDPSRVCICNDTKLNCLIVVNTEENDIYPGQNITLSAAVVGQDLGIVQSQIVAKVFSSPNSSIPTEQKTMKYDKKGNCNNFTYTVYSRCTACKATLVLTPDYRRITKSMNVDDNCKLETSWSILLSEPNYNVLAIRYIKKYFYSGQDYLTFNKTYYAQNADNTIDNFFTISPEVLPENGTNLRNKLRFPKEIYNYPLYNTIHFKPCPLGFTLSVVQSKCDCDHILQQIPTVECNIQEQTITRGGSVWIGTFDNQTLAFSNNCPLHYCKAERVKLSLHDHNSSKTNSQCNFNHAGVLCGGCQHGLSLVLGSDRCTHCSSAYLILIVPLILAGVVLVLFLKTFDFTVCQGTINGYNMLTL